VTQLKNESASHARIAPERNIHRVRRWGDQKAWRRSSATSLVTNIENNEWRVFYDELKNGQRVPGSQTARIVIVAAGSFGSTELLLRCRDLSGSLPRLSQFLGRDWSSNGDFLTPAVYPFRGIQPSRGPISFHPLGPSTIT
jgi:hypothetical protein